MLKTVEVKCPACLNMFLNIRGFDEVTKNPKLDLVNQTIDIYDTVSLKESRHGNGDIQVTSNDNLSLELKNNILKIAALFFEHTDIKPNSFFIEVLRQKEILNGLNLESSIIAGVLLGLNHYYDTNLTKKELINLASQIGTDIPYFIVSGYASVTNNGIDIEKLGSNPYTNYLIIDPKIPFSKEEMIEEIREYPILKRSSANTIHNDFSSIMPSGLAEIREHLFKYKEIRHSLAGISSLYFVASSLNLSKISIALKREFPYCKVYNCTNTSKHKILVTYPMKKINK